MLPMTSATCPETAAIAASRWSTSFCRRRTSGATTNPVTAIRPSSTTTSIGSYCHSTTDANMSGTTFATIENATVSTNSSNRVAKLSTRLVSEPAKLSWKNAASLASSSSMPSTYRLLDAVPVGPVETVQADPPDDLRDQQRRRRSPSTQGATVANVAGIPSTSRPASPATNSGAR